MKNILLLALILLLVPLVQVNAFHLIGGDLEMQHVRDYTYKMILYQYADDTRSNGPLLDGGVVVFIYEKGTNKEMRYVFMRRTWYEKVKYTNTACVAEDLINVKGTYSAEFRLDPLIYNSPRGYYAVWERCCRNSTINNIVRPASTGQLYYLEFPAVIRNGQPFVNASPTLSPPIRDYACLNEEFSYDFSAKDPDGDEIRYGLMTPGLAHWEKEEVDILAQPGPYRRVPWAPGYSESNQVMGNPGLKIHPATGRLTVTPTMKGIFIFGVRYSEYRNGEKIGEVWREFQLLVKECNRNDPPVITAREVGKRSDYQEGQVARIRSTGPRCLDLFLTDQDKNERLYLSAVPVNFTLPGFKLAGQTSGPINQGAQNDSLRASLCFDNCFDTEGKVFYLDLIVSDFGDGGCGLPKQDTLRVGIMVEAAPSPVKPAISFSIPDRILYMEETQLINFDVTGSDPEKNPIKLSVRGQGFDIGEHNIVFEDTLGLGEITFPFSWKLDCKANERTIYRLEFTVTTFACTKPVQVSEVIEVRISRKTVGNNRISGDQVICYGGSPDLLTGTPPTSGTGVYRYRWEVSTTDPKSGYTETTGRNSTYQPRNLTQTSWFRRAVYTGACFDQVLRSEPVRIEVYPFVERPQAEAVAACPGLPATLSVTAPDPDLTYGWYDKATNGNLLHTGPTYVTAPLTANAMFYVQATNSRGCSSTGRTEVQVQVLPRTADAGPDETMISGQYVTLKGNGGVRYQWSPQEGLSNPVIYNPIARPTETTTYTLSVTTVEGCVFTDSMVVTVLAPISPKNAITLNGDGKNDKWFIDNIELYPKASIQVFSRWGAKVFESTGYKRAWDGTNEGKELPVGTYFYIIKLEYEEKPFTGSISLMR